MFARQIFVIFANKLYFAKITVHENFCLQKCVYLTHVMMLYRFKVVDDSDSKWILGVAFLLFTW